MERRSLIQAPRELHTPRLRLVWPVPEVAAPFAESLNASLPALRFIHWGQHAVDVAWAERFCEGGRALVDEGDCLIFHALRRDDGAHVGRIDLHSFDFHTPRAEIGYVGDVRQSGQGLMREAVRAVMGLGFSLGLVRIEAISEVDNTRALHFAEHALGMVREGRLHHRERDAQGRLCDQWMFAAFAPQREDAASARSTAR
jgi:RimJ/RimL family protein N-acetyltransferase